MKNQTESHQVPPIERLYKNHRTIFLLLTIPRRQFVLIVNTLMSRKSANNSSFKLEKSANICNVYTMMIADCSFKGEAQPRAR